MYKEWMNMKWTKKDFRLKNDDDKRLWVRLPDGKSDEEVGPINLVFDETNEFNEVVKKYILNGMREYNQCFITMLVYIHMWTHDGDPKILNLTDDRLGHLRIVRRNSIDEFIDGTSDGTGTPWKSKRRKEVDSYTKVGSVSTWRCFHSVHLLDTNIQRLWLSVAQC